MSLRSSTIQRWCWPPAYPASHHAGPAQSAGSKACDAQAAVRVDDAPGGEGEGARCERRHNVRHVLALAPSACWHEAVGNQPIVFLGDASRHVSSDDARANIENPNAFGREPEG